MTIGVNLRAALGGAALSLALGLAPAAAQADSAAPATNGGAPGVYVCNEAGMAFVGGALDVIDPSQDPNPPARHKTALKALPGHGVGLVNAASHSPALALCGDPAPVVIGPGDGSLSGSGSTGVPTGTGDPGSGGPVLSGANG